MNSGRPPIRPRVMVLPFDDSQQSWVWFEEAVRDLFRRISSYTNVEAYGVQGDHQEGIDVRADIDDEHLGIQCKKERDFPGTAVAQAVSDTTYEADRFIIALSRKATAGARREIDRHPRWELWDQTRLSDEVRALPHDDAVDYVERHFHAAYVEEFLGRGRATTFLSRDEAFLAFQDTTRLIHHEWARVPDGGALDALQAFVDSDQRVALVNGPIGSGKTKLLYDLTANDLGRNVYFVAAGATITRESLREITAGPALIVLDNAEDASAVLSAVIQLALTRPEMKAILTTSSASKSTIEEQLADDGVEPAGLCNISTNRLNRQATITLSRAVLGREDAEAEEAIVVYASDSPLTTILTARMIRDRTTTSAGLQSENHVRELTRSLYRDVAIGSVARDMPREDVKSVVQLLAATGPSRVERDDWLDPAAAFLGWTQERLLRVIDAIDEARILSRTGSKYAVAPEMLRQSIMLDACTAGGRRTDFPDRVFEHFPYNAHVLHNLAIADLDSKTSSGPDLFQEPWNGIAQGVRAGTSFDRSHFLGEIETLGFLKPDEVFELVNYLVAHPATNDHEQPYPTAGIDQDSVLRHVPAVLKNVMAGSRERLPACVELLWRIGKTEPQRFSTGSSIHTIASLAGYEVGVGTGRAMAIVDTVEQMIARGEEDTEKHSLLDLIVPVLARDVHAGISQGTRYTVRRLVVGVASARELRDRAIAVFTAVAQGANCRRSDKALRMLAELFREPMNQATPPADDVVAAWDRERTMVIDAYNQIIDAGTFPLRELRIAHEIPFYAQYSPSAIVRDGCQALLARLGQNHERDRYRALSPDFVRADTFVDVRRERESDLGGERRARFIASVATEMIATLGDASALIADLRARIAVIDAAGLYASPRDLLTDIVSQRPDLREPFLDALLGAADPALIPWVEPFLRATFLEDPSAGEALARRMLEIEHPYAGIAVASGLIYRAIRADGDCAIRTRLLASLLGMPSLEIRLAAAHSLMFFKNTCPAAIPQLVLDAAVGSDAKLADRLFMALPNDLAGIDDEMRSALAAKLAGVQELEYWPLQFLAHMAPTQSARVIDILTQRLFLRDAPEKYQSVPFSESEMLQLIRGLAESPTFETELRAAIRARADVGEDALSDFARFLGHIARIAPDMVKSMIEEALGSESDALQRAALSWVESLPHDVVEGDVPFVVAVLERAHAISEAMGKRAEGKISVELFTGAESVGHYEGAPSDLRAQTIARTALAFDHLTVPVRRFFNRLLEHGRRSEEAIIHNAEEVFGPQ